MMNYNLILIGNSEFIFDFERFSEIVRLSGSTTITTTQYKQDTSGQIIGDVNVEVKAGNGQEIDSVKWELLKALLDVVFLTEVKEDDNMLPVSKTLEDAPLAFKLAFNTLLKEGIIREI